MPDHSNSHSDNTVKEGKDVRNAVSGGPQRIQAERKSWPRKEQNKSENEAGISKSFLNMNRFAFLADLSTFQCLTNQ